MKVARFVLKIVAASLALAAAVCCVIAYWDKITDCMQSVIDRFGGKTYYPSEYDDYADWEID